MSQAAPFLLAFGQCLATMNLYGEGHPARLRALETGFERLQRLLEEQGAVELSVLGAETVLGERVLQELGQWDWGPRLAAAGLERIEIAPGVTREAWDGFVDEAWRRVTGRGEPSSEARQLVAGPIRWGPLAVRGAATRAARLVEEAVAAPAPGAGLTLAEEAAAVAWIHGEVAERDAMPMLEVEAVVRSLALAMQAERRMLLPLLELKRFDQYTTTHACNVAVLAMGLTERLGLGREEVRGFGVAGLLHDIGKVRIPKEILTKPGKLSDEERQVMNRHPVDGAAMVLAGERGLGLAAVVAYEHHVCIDGTGYPAFRWRRDCHYASRIVHVCDVYDALCTNRTYRAAWEPERALEYIAGRAGTEFDPQVAQAFIGMVRESATARVALAE